MKIFKAPRWLIVGWLAVWVDTAWAGQDSSANPYATIADRNVFGLVRDSAQPPVPVPPLPRIVPRGFATLLRPELVLFEVVDDTCGKPATPRRYALRTGETQDGYSVMRVDPASATILFNNHGALQNIPLVGPTATTH